MAELDPFLKKMLDAAAALPPHYNMTPQQARENIRKRIAGLPPNCSSIGKVHDLSIKAAGRNIACRLYLPQDRDGQVPLVVFLHGGGWCVCDIETHDGQCRRICSESGAAVLSVGYSLAPEHPFPAAFDECTEIAEWSRRGLAAFGVDGERMALCGDSAGGNLAAAVALKLRGTGANHVRAQALLYPALLPLGMMTESRELFGKGYGLDLDQIGKYWSAYAPACPDFLDTPVYCAPGLASDLSDLPATYVLTAEYDPLRDEGEAFAQRLAASGVTATVRRAPGVNHGFLAFETVLAEAGASMIELGRWLSAQLAI